VKPIIDALTPKSDSTIEGLKYEFPPNIVEDLKKLVACVVVE